MKINGCSYATLDTILKQNFPEDEDERFIQQFLNLLASKSDYEIKSFMNKLQNELNKKHCETCFRKLKDKKDKCFCHPRYDE